MRTRAADFAPALQQSPSCIPLPLQLLDRSDSDGERVDK
jgi:hypothetical protein